MNFVHVYNIHILCYCIAGCFYLTIANLPPRLQTRLNAIQAIAFAKSEHISTYGISHVLPMH